jgi:threonine aldolase
MKILDLRSDTVTRPTAGMLEAMIKATLGDDVFAEDPTVKKLEEHCAEMLGMEAGLFFPSGTMSNQVAIKAQTQPLDEIICDRLSHIYNYETGGWAFHSGVSIRLTEGDQGRMNVPQAEACILPDRDWFPNSRMLCIENTVNKGGGCVYRLEQIQSLSKFCKERGLIFHLDGARLFNAFAAGGYSASDLHGLFNSISICFSKGLGAPAGSLLVSDAETIRKARKIRKVMGGGMRQSGILAAACLYALENHVSRLPEDHRKAKEIAELLRPAAWVKSVLPVETNILIFEVSDSSLYEQKLKEQGILSSPFSPTHIRVVTHLDLDNENWNLLPERLSAIQ